MQGKIEGRAVCKHCHREITQYGGLWWTPNDDMMCAPGETQHEPQTMIEYRVILRYTTYDEIYWDADSVEDAKALAQQYAERRDRVGAVIEAVDAVETSKTFEE